MAHDLNTREVATLVAALRMWQANPSLRGIPQGGVNVQSVATDGDSFLELQYDEIDNLAQRLQRGPGTAAMEDRDAIVRIKAEYERLDAGVTMGEACNFIHEVGMVLAETAKDNIANQRVAERTRIFDENYPEVMRTSNDDSYVGRGVAVGLMAVRPVLNDELGEFLREEHGGDYMTGEPSIELTLGGTTHFLNWSEAYGLGFSLIHCADVGHYG